MDTWTLFATILRNLLLNWMVLLPLLMAVLLLPRLPGQAAARYAHLLSGQPELPAVDPSAAASAPRATAVAAPSGNGLERLAQLEARVLDLEARLVELETRLTQAGG